MGARSRERAATSTSSTAVSSARGSTAGGRGNAARAEQLGLQSEPYPRLPSPGRSFVDAQIDFGGLDAAVREAYAAAAVDARIDRPGSAGGSDCVIDPSVLAAARAIAGDDARGRSGSTGPIEDPWLMCNASATVEITASIRGLRALDTPRRTGPMTDAGGAVLVDRIPKEFRRGTVVYDVVVRLAPLRNFTESIKELAIDMEDGERRKEGAGEVRGVEVGTVTLLEAVFE